MTRLARLRRADLGRRRVGPRGNLGNIYAASVCYSNGDEQLLGARVWFRAYQK